MTTSPSDQILILAEQVNTDDASDLHARLLSLRFGPVSIDATRTRCLPALVAQVLAAGALLWRQDGKAFRVQCSAAVRADLSNLGLTFPEFHQEVHP